MCGEAMGVSTKKRDFSTYPVIFLSVREINIIFSLKHYKMQPKKKKKQESGNTNEILSVNSLQPHIILPLLKLC